MKKWVFSGIGYLLVVIIGWSIYSFTAEQEATEVQSGHGEDSHAHGTEAQSDGHGEHDSHGKSAENGVEIDFEATSEAITIQLKDQHGKALDKLEMNHEKLLHLIIVDEHLEKYYHLHPEKTGEGHFQLGKALAKGSYKAFVDIKPTNVPYHVEPIPFTIGEAEEGHSHGLLKPDKNFAKTVNGVETKLDISSSQAGEDAVLSFSFPENTKLEPYLGAMGHVVILNENAEQFIHVHPLNDTETKFQTNFSEPGIYKLWGEFQINGEIHTYPFVIEVK